MDKYIYFAAEMPMLKWDDEGPVISIGHFLEEAEKWMTPSDYSVLARSVIHNYALEDIRGIFREYRDFEYGLRRELAEYRKAAKEGYEYKFTGIPSRLVKEGDPLEVEIALIRYRWQWLEDHEFGHYSDLDFFVLYYLKLQLLKRLSRFEKEAGEEAFRQVIENIIENNKKPEASP